MFSRNEIGGFVGQPQTGRQPWWSLEEYKPDGGMWKAPAVLMKDEHVRAAAELMCDPGKFKDAMRRVLKEWPNSVANAFETPGLNLRAWMGHAGCYLATGSPEESTRLGWHTLDDGEQFAANAAADEIIAEHRRAQQDPGQQMLWEGDYA